jgi:transglutaminase-like putative cysteine protease
MSVPAVATPRVAAVIVASWIAVALLGSVRAAEPGARLYNFSAPPAWVKTAAPEYEASLPASGVSNGVWYLMLDRQISVTADGDDYYQHSATRVISTNGVDEESQFDITVDPTYQSLTLHSLRVIRDGQAMDQRSVARITALPQETEVRKRVYNGGYNVNILLSDVRVGDIVELAYTIHSRDRIFPGLFSARVAIGWSMPIRWQRIRILAPADRELFFRASDGQGGPVEAVHGGLHEFNWEWHDLAATTADDDLPRWYTPWPHLEVSDSRNWSVVAQRVAPLFEVSEPPTPELTALVDGIRRAGGSPEEQALHALQFVQEQIRYVSISIGPGAFRPASPGTVPARRFGDCKDKAQLLAVMLRALGIEAEPALVNTRRGRVLDSELPTPYIFDHAIVRMTLGGQVYWLDGTEEEQYSPLSTESPADYERALVIDPATTELSQIPRPASNVGSKESDVLIDLRAGADQPATLQIRTSYRGKLADSIRRDLANDSPAERQSSHVNYIARYYPGAKTSAPITIHDDKFANIVIVSEYYDLDRTFRKNANGKLEFFLQADELYRYVNTLESSIRTAPLAVAYPVQVRQTVRALLPDKWPVKDEDVAISNPAFKYQSTVRYSELGKGPQITLDYSYESLVDSVDVGALAQYQADRKRAYDDLGYYIRPKAKAASPERPQAFALGPCLTAALSLVVGSWIAIRLVYRWDPQPARAEQNWPLGIRGWLSVPALYTVVAPLSWIAWLYTESRVLREDHWLQIQDTVPEPLRAWAPALLLMFTAFGLLLLVGHVLLVFLFFSRRSSAPPVFIAMQWTSALVYVATLLFLISAHLNNVRLDVTGLLGALLRPGIYTAYMLLSKRVKATFVVRLGERAPWRAPAANVAM